tara:strand:+ start:14471 stop:16681 length:2211 start_codon:yes stop_codon:yes gene_type:complete
MKIKDRKKREVATVPEPLDYDNLLVDHNGDPFDFLRGLKNKPDSKGDDFDPSTLGAGGASRSIGSFDADMLSREVDISSMVRSVLDENSLVPKDVKIDDGDFPLAKNFYEWVMKDHFAGTVMTPFLEQLIWGIVVYGEWCPRCSDNTYLFETHLANDTFAHFEKKICLLEHGVCPSCHAKKSDMVRSGEMPFYQELAVCAGQRSGKSAATGGMLTPYLTHRVLKMQKPNDVYGIAGSTMLHGTFVALTYAQAKETLWEFYYGTLCESEWFKGYHGMLRYYEEQYGQSLLKFNDTFVVYRPRSLMFYPAGPDKRVLRGRTRIFAGIDEIGWFDNAADSKKVKTSAREVYTALDRSLLTVRGAADRLINSGFDNILTGYSMNVSSPSSQRDKICELVRQSMDSDTMYGILRPTWEVNPTLPKTSKVITSEYQKNPLDAERDYGANPPLSANPYITNKDWLAKALGDKPNKIKLRDKVKNRKRKGSATKWAEVEKVGKCRKPTMLAIDAGYTNNSFACVVGRLNDMGEVQINLMFEIMPEQGIPLNYTMIMEEVLEEVMSFQNTQVVLADRWNSVKILQDIEQGLDIVAEQYSLKYKDIGLTRSFLEAGSLKLPRMSKETKSVDDAMHFDADVYPHCYKGYPMEHFVLQALTVQDTGTQVNKGDGLTDDLWRALCLLVWGLTNEKYDEFMMLPEADEEDERFRPQAFAVSKLGSGGGRALGGGNGTSFEGNLGVIRRGR